MAYVDPTDVKSIRQAYKMVLTNEMYREDLIERGLENAKRFSVEQIAQQYVELYQNLYQA